MRGETPRIGRQWSVRVGESSRVGCRVSIRRGCARLRKECCLRLPGCRLGGRLITSIVVGVMAVVFARFAKSHCMARHHRPMICLCTNLKAVNINFTNIVWINGVCRLAVTTVAQSAGESLIPMNFSGFERLAQSLYGQATTQICLLLQRLIHVTTRTVACEPRRRNGFD